MKFKSFVGLERLQSGADIKFLERSYVTNAILPNRDSGIAVHGEIRRQIELRSWSG